MSYTPPKGWREVPLPEALFFQEGPGLRKHQFRESGIPFLNIRTFKQGRVDRSLCQFLGPEEVDVKYQHFLLQADDIICSSSGTIGRIATITERDLPLMLNTSVIRFRPLDEREVERGWIRVFLQSQYFLEQARSAATGSAQSNFGPTHLKQMSFVAPPVAEQRRIVARIEELFSRLDAGVAALRHAKAQLQRYRQSVLAAAVTGQLTQTWREKNDLKLDEWESLSIDDISEVKTGKTPKRSEPEFWTNGTVPWLTSSATGNAFTHQADQFVTQAALDAGLKMFEPGTLLLAMYGEGKTRGQVTEITFQATCNQACAAIIVNEARAFRPFVRLCLQESYDQTRKAASGGNQPNLNLTKVREIPLRLPSLGEQEQIVAEVEARTTVIDHLEAELDRQFIRSNRLRQSTLSSAFSGAI